MRGRSRSMLNCLSPGIPVPEHEILRVPSVAGCQTQVPQTRWFEEIMVSIFKSDVGYPALIPQT